MTKIVVKSHNEPSSERNIFIRDMLYDVSGIEPTQLIYSELGYKFPMFIVDHMDVNETKETIDAIYDILSFPHDKYHGLNKNDFTLTIESDTIDPVIAHLIEKQNEFIDHKIKTFGEIIEDLATDQKKQEDKLEAIYSFLHESGLLFYRQTITHMASQMDKANMIDLNQLQDQIFPKIH